ncbi:MAG: hypothetical protein JNK67_26165 [Alphaproteobacteria bacterium]|nr:hypothetical protein [Alphaproteobacteria bacterium]
MTAATLTTPRYRRRGLAMLVAAATTAGVSAAQMPAQPTPEAATIRVPQPFAIELAPRHRDSIRPDETPLAELLGAAFAGTATVTHDLVDAARLGITRVTFTARQDAAASGPALARRTLPLLVLPFGQTPIGVSGDERATASNNAARILRDDTGRLHVAWLEAIEGRVRVMYLRGAPRDGGGATAWEAPPEPLSDPASTPWNAYVAIAPMPDGVIVAWQGGDGVVLRRIARRGEEWRVAPPIATRIAGDGPEMGVSLVARADEIAMLTPSGLLARSGDGGLSWRTAAIPLPPGGKPKNIAMDVDRRGNLHVVYALPAGDDHWALRYVRHEPAAGWTDAQDMLADSPAWRRPTAPGQILADFPTLRVDRRDGLHVAWHGTANTRAFGKDEAFYRHRPAEAGSWGAWQPIQALWPNAPDVSQAAFAPSLSLDPATDSAVAVTFFVNARGAWETGARLLRDGALHGDRIFLSRKRAEGAVMPTEIWFASAAPIVHRPTSGGAWLEMVQTVKLPAELAAHHVIVHQGADLERVLSADSGVPRTHDVAMLLEDGGTLAAIASAMLAALLASALVIVGVARRRRQVTAMPRRRPGHRRGPRDGADTSRP